MLRYLFEHASGNPCNVFWTSIKHKSYTLDEFQASKHEKEKKSPTFKDLDYLELLPEGLLLEPDTYHALCKTMERDCRVLESFKIMDYSLLVGVHNIDMASKEREEALADESSLPESDQEPRSRALNEKSRERLVAHSTAMESIQVFVQS